MKNIREKRMALHAYILIGASLLVCDLAAEPVAVSFLDNMVDIKRTGEMLKRAGASEESASRFELVALEYLGGSGVWDKDGFPAPNGDGLYEFATIDGLIKLLPKPLSGIDRPYQFNNFDGAFAAVIDQIKCDLRPDEITEPILVSHVSTNGNWTVRPVATPRDGFVFVYPEWYRRATEPFFRGDAAESRVTLTSALFRWYPLPFSMTDDSMEGDVMNVLNRFWKRHGLEFPQAIEVVLVHLVNDAEKTVNTQHMGLLIPQPSGFYYLEKNGGSGPFVLIKLGNRDDLMKWLADTYHKNPETGYTHVLATFGDKQIVTVRD